MPATPTPTAACTHEQTTVSFPGGSFCSDCGTVEGPTHQGGPVFHWWKHWDGSANLATLTMVANHMARAGFAAGDVAYMIEKPYRFTDEFRAAVAALPGLTS